MFMAVNDGISDIHGEEFPGQSEFHSENCRSHTERMFDISAKLVKEQDEIQNLETISWERHSWKYMSLIDDERIIKFQRAKV